MARVASCTALLVAVSLVLVACGGANTGDGGTAPVRPTKTSGPKAERIIATLGDSIVAGSPQWDPDTDARQGLARVDEDSQWQRWVTAAPPAELRNCGAPGERTDQIAQRFAACVDGADAVVIQGGINDIAQGRPVGEAGDDLECMVDRAIEADLPVAVIDLLPWNNGYPDAAPKIHQLNARIHALAKARGIPVLPFFETLEDPAKRDRMVAKLTIEGSHPNVAGYRRLGEQAWREPILATPARSKLACAE